MRSKTIGKNWLEDDVNKLKKELKEAQDYILAQEALVQELVSQIETKDEIEVNSDLELHKMECAIRYAVATLYGYEQSIKKFGLLFGAGQVCINKLKEVIGDKE